MTNSIRFNQYREKAGGRNRRFLSAHPKVLLVLLSAAVPLLVIAAVAAAAVLITLPVCWLLGWL